MKSELPRFEIMEPYKHSVLWFQQSADEGFCLELHDFSDEAEASFGNDVAWTWTVTSENRTPFLLALAARTGVTFDDSKEAVAQVLRSRFDGWPSLSSWLKSYPNLISVEFNSWA